MPDTPMNTAATVDHDFEVVVEQFLRERETGNDPDRQRYLESFPQFAPLLRDFFAGQDLFDRLAPELAPCVRETSPALPALGERIGDFELIEELGRGGMGVVYRARQTKLDRIVALKMIRRGEASDAELARFRIEAEAIARLQHPNIVQLYEVGEHDGMPFVVLEYCAGGSLEERLRGTTLPPVEAAVVVAALARAMHAAHEHNVIHRDLKSANVLLAGGDTTTPLDRLTPKISDFGLARKLDDPGLTQSGVIMGTPSYMAPEQVRGQSKEVGPAADVYALGAVLYECLTGRPPFRAATALDTLTQVLGSEPAPPRQLNPAVPRDLETICLKCLHKERGKRYSSAAELADDLRRFLEGRPITARRTPGYERLWRWCRRNPAAASASAAALLLLAAVVVVSVVFAVQQHQSALREADAAARLGAEKEQVARALEEAKRNEARLTLEHALALCEEGAQGKYRDPYTGLTWLARALELAPADATELQRVLRLNWAAWSRDLCPLQDIFDSGPGFAQVEWGRAGKILVGTANQLHGWNAATGQPIPVPDHLPTLAKTDVMSCSRDGRWVATPVAPELAHGHDINLLVWDLQSGQLHSLAAPHPDAVTAVALSPDGSLIVTGCADGKVRLWERATGNLHGQPFDMPGPIKAVAFRPDGQVFAAGTRSGKSRATVRQWDIATGKPFGGPIENSWSCHSLAYSDNGKSLLVAFGHFLALYDAESAKWLPPVLVQGEAIERARFAPDGQTLISCSVTGETYVWDLYQRRPVVAPISSTNGFSDVAINPNGQSVATANWVEGVRTWQLPPRPAHLRLSERGPSLPDRDGVGVGYDRRGLRAVAVSPDGKWLATGGWDRTVEVWHAETGQPAATLSGHTGVVTALAFSQDSTRLLSGSADRTARLWDVQTGKQVGRPFEHGGAVQGVAVSPNGAHLLTGAGDGTCKLWKVTDEVVQEWNPQGTAPVWAVAFNPDGQSCAAALWQGVKFCDLVAPEKVWGTKSGTHHIMAVAFSPDGKRFIAGGMDNSAQVRETVSGKPVSAVLHHRERTFQIDEPDRIAPLPWMGTALWNRSRLLSVAYHPKGGIVATGDQGRTARLWDADSGVAIGPPLEHPGGVHGMTFTPDGKHLVTVSTDRVVRRWPVPVAVEGDPALLRLRTEVITGLELVDGAVRRLDAEAHRARRRRLEELAPPRFPL